MASGNLANKGGPVSFVPGLNFSVLFLMAATFCAGVIARWPGMFVVTGRDITVASVKALTALLGITLGGEGDILIVNGFAMKIVAECTALHYVIILALAILLYTGHSIGYRVFGVIAATASVLAANAIRLVSTGLVGSISPASFHFVHEYLWVALFALLVFGIWKVWADGSLMVGRVAARRALEVIVCCSLTFLLLFVVKDLHNRLLATIASPLFKLLVSDPQAYVIWDGRHHALNFSQGGTRVMVGSFFDNTNIAVYLGLMLPKLRQGRKMLIAALVGLLLLIVTYAEFVAILGVHCIRHIEAANLYLGTGTGVLLALPMAVYWMVVKLASEN